MDDFCWKYLFCRYERIVPNITLINAFVTKFMIQNLKPEKSIMLIKSVYIFWFISSPSGIYIFKIKVYILFRVHEKLKIKIIKIKTYRVGRNLNILRCSSVTLTETRVCFSSITFKCTCRFLLKKFYFVEANYFLIFQRSSLILVPNRIKNSENNNFFLMAPSASNQQILR